MAGSCQCRDASTGIGKGQQEPLTLGALVEHVLQCRTELAFLQYSMRRLSSSPAWTSELGEHLETLEDLLRRESSKSSYAMATLPAASVAHLQAKACAVRELCDPKATDLQNTLAISLCNDVLALAGCSFHTNDCE
jgi:hypothetical protein